MQVDCGSHACVANPYTTCKPRVGLSITAVDGQRNSVTFLTVDETVLKCNTDTQNTIFPLVPPPPIKQTRTPTNIRSAPTAAAAATRTPCSHTTAALLFCLGGVVPWHQVRDCLQLACRPCSQALFAVATACIFHYCFPTCLLLSVSLPLSGCLPLPKLPYRHTSMASSAVSAWTECLQQLERNNTLPPGDPRLEDAAHRVLALGLHKIQVPVPKTWRKLVVDLQVRSRQKYAH